MQLLFVLATAAVSVSAVDFMGLDISQSCSDYIGGLDPKIDAMGPKVAAIETAAVGTSVERQAKDANTIAKDSLALYKADRQKKASQLSADRATGLTDLNKGKAALATISAAPDSTPQLTAAVKDLNDGIADIKTYARAGTRPCATDLRTLRAGFKDVGAPQAQVINTFQSMMGDVE